MASLFVSDINLLDHVELISIKNKLLLLSQFLVPWWILLLDILIWTKLMNKLSKRFFVSDIKHSLNNIVSLDYVEYTLTILL